VLMLVIGGQKSEVRRQNSSSLGNRRLFLTKHIFLDFARWCCGSSGAKIEVSGPRTASNNEFRMTHLRRGTAWQANDESRARGAQRRRKMRKGVATIGGHPLTPKLQRDK